MLLCTFASTRWLIICFGLTMLASCAANVGDAGAEDDDLRNRADTAPSLHGAFPVVRHPAFSASLNGEWQHHALPGKKPTTYAFSPVDSRPALLATANSSASVLRQPVKISAEALKQITFSWKVPNLIQGADLTQRETHDSPVRVALAFDGDRSQFSMKNAMLSELALTLTGEPLPYATLMYVWCNQCTPGEVIVNPRTDRIREIALESGPAGLGQWRDYERDIHADFEKAFGERPGALMTVGLMTDTDNTRGSTSAWYGPIALTN